MTVQSNTEFLEPSFISLELRSPLFKVLPLTQNTFVMYWKGCFENLVPVQEQYFLQNLWQINTLEQTLFFSQPFRRASSTFSKSAITVSGIDNDRKCCVQEEISQRPSELPMSSRGRVQTQIALRPGISYQLVC